MTDPRESLYLSTLSQPPLSCSHYVLYPQVDQDHKHPRCVHDLSITEVKGPGVNLITW